MRNWHSRLIEPLKWLCLWLLLPLFLLLMLISTVDALRAPDLPGGITHEILHTIDGKEVTLASLSEKKPLLVWFWGRWCSACSDTLPLMVQLNNQRTNVLSIASRSGNDISVVRYLNGQHLTLPVVNDSHSTLATRWRIDNTPMLLIVAKGDVVIASSGWTSNTGIKLRLWWVRKWHY